ncbi:Adiponectin receptor protein [Strongyloides ratti]|uniref:Adiponectin receptor protein n=1 Tax=Strongyloides ratti TaxID=34506 RepID=A0A090MZA8_STRRB|nr:Adiponectin receptor protein [Strongyloides ratti]CEF68609.1 Adiponectin receptor protein [Strongyloides ratti]
MLRHSSCETLTTIVSLDDNNHSNRTLEESNNIFNVQEDTVSLASSISTLDYDFEGSIQEETIDVFRSETQKKIRNIFNFFPKLINFENLPDWLKDNQFIRSGYRAPSDSIKYVFFSLIQFHNETINIWTHLVGSIMFFSACIWVMSRPNNLVPANVKWIFLPFFLGSIMCMTCSAAFHLFFFKSQKFGAIFSKLDYSGIALLIIGSFIPWIYFVFECQPHLVIIYISMITVIGILAVIVSLFDKFAQPRFRPLRAGIFLTMGLSAIFPGIHLLLIESWDIIVEKELLKWNIIMGSLYVIGALQYALRIPERFCMGKFDYLFHSHQFFHIFVVIAASLHFYGISRVTVNKISSGSCEEQAIEILLEFNKNTYKLLLKC